MSSRVHAPAGSAALLFPEGQSDAFLGQILGGHPLTWLPQADDVFAAYWGMDMLGCRLRVMLGLWALPDFPSDGVVNTLRFTPGAHPFRVEANLVELRRQGVPFDHKGAETWRGSVRHAVNEACSRATRMSPGIGDLGILKSTIGFSVGEPLPVSETYRLAAHVWGRELTRCIAVAAEGVADRVPFPDMAESKDVARRDARNVLFREARLHAAGEPMRVPGLAPEDLVMLVTSDFQVVRELGMSLAGLVEQVA